MPKTYSVEVRLFALRQRAEGHPWERVRELVRAQFGIDPPPSRRQMEKWTKDTDRRSLARVTLRELRRGLPHAEEEIVARAGDGLVLKLLAADLAGHDVPVVIGVWLVGLMEDILGTDRFKQVLEEYLKDLHPSWKLALPSDKGHSDEIERGQ